MLSIPVERLWLSSGPAGGGRNVGCVFSDGAAMVRGCHRSLHLACEQPEAGVQLLRTGGTTQVPGHQGATGHRRSHFHPHGLLCLHDIHPEGQRSRMSTHENWL